MSPLVDLGHTSEVFVMDTVDGPEVYLTARDLARAVLDGIGFHIVTKTFEATVRVLTDGRTSPEDLTGLFTDAYMEHARERSATTGYGAREVVRGQHIDMLVDRISAYRMSARLHRALGATS